MTREALPPLLRGIGMTMILVATVVAFVIAREDSAREHAERQVSDVEHSATVDLQSLASEIRELRAEVEVDDVVEEVLDNPWFELLSLIGTGVFASSFYVEAYVRRSKSDPSSRSAQ